MTGGQEEGREYEGAEESDHVVDGCTPAVRSHLRTTVGLTFEQLGENRGLEG